MLDDEKPKVSLSEPEVPMDDEELVNIEDLTELDTEELANEESDEINEVDELRAENAELNDRLMRALAEAENQRKRGERDRRDAEVYGGRKLARDLLSVYDNMKRASEMAT
ncbi:nucleotide exchange factor GrpE, partial [Amylibacter sp.]|nr:nucleotide exchange factor GrpE [Amylibacter sp.]